MTQLVIANLAQTRSLELTASEQQLVLGGQAAPTPGPTGPVGPSLSLALNIGITKTEIKTATLNAVVSGSEITGGINQTVNF